MSGKRIDLNTHSGHGLSMKTIEGLTEKLERYMQGYWKEIVNPLLVGGHLTSHKAIQYAKGMVAFDDLEPYYQKTYRQDAREIIALCVEYVEALIEEETN